MSYTIVCDRCKKPIDAATPFTTIIINKTVIVEGAPKLTENSERLDYHNNHLPKLFRVTDPDIPIEGQT